ncbi:hypothetical protein BH160DRAFT_7041 [Burkholderia sp. H160]|nr:hypothetical protein BH160DRAFT_7041 [Burkholderia sp. H160]
MAKEWPGRDERPCIRELINGLNGTSGTAAPNAALQLLGSLGWKLTAKCTTDEARLLARLEEFIGYLENNQRFFVNFGDGYRHREPITLRFVESAVNQMVSKRFVKR